MRGYAGHPLSAAFTAWISSLTVTSPLPSVSIAVQVSSDALPKAMFTAVIRLLTVTCPSLSQSPAHGAVTVHAQAFPRTQDLNLWRWCLRVSDLDRLHCHAPFYQCDCKWIVGAIVAAHRECGAQGQNPALASNDNEGSRLVSDLEIGLSRVEYNRAELAVVLDDQVAVGVELDAGAVFQVESPLLTYNRVDPRVQEVFGSESSAHQAQHDCQGKNGAEVRGLRRAMR